LSYGYLAASAAPMAQQYSIGVQSAFRRWRVSAGERTGGLATNRCNFAAARLSERMSHRLTKKGLPTKADQAKTRLQSPTFYHESTQL